MTTVTERFTAVYNFLTIKVIFMPLISIFSRKRFVFLNLSKLCISAKRYNSLQERQNFAWSMFCGFQEHLFLC